MVHRYCTQIFVVLNALQALILFPAKKIVSYFIYFIALKFYSFHSFSTFKKGPTNGIRLKDVFITQLLNSRLVSFFLINLDFLLLRTEQFVETIILLFFCFFNFRVFNSICLFLYFLKNKITLFYKYIKTFNWLIKFLSFWFLCSCQHTLWTHCLLNQIHYE